MPFSLTPKDSSFYPLFTASAENLVAATDVLSEFIHDHARRPELAVKLRDLEHVTGIIVTHQIRDAFYVATHRASRQGDAVQIDAVPEDAPPPADFLVLHDGRIRFEGTSSELLAAADEYLKEMLFMTLPPW